VFLIAILVEMVDIKISTHNVKTVLPNVQPASQPPSAHHVHQDSTSMVLTVLLLWLNSNLSLFLLVQSPKEVTQPSLLSAPISFLMDCHLPNKITSSLLYLLQLTLTMLHTSINGLVLSIVDL